jgi:hypothetical protein
MRKLNKIAANTTSEITVALDAADAVAATLTRRVALDASDKPVNLEKSETFNPGLSIHAFSDFSDYALESSLEKPDITLPAPPAFIDPLAPYAEDLVKLSYLIPGMTLDIGTLYLGKVARDKAVEFANNPKVREKVGIFCATTGTKITEVLPMAKGASKVTSKAVATPRQTSKADSRIVLTEEEKAWLADYDAAISEDKEREKARKALEAYYAKWHADYNAAVKANEKFDQERAARLAKIMKANRRHPDPASKEYQDWLIFTSEDGGTCVELNHNRDVLYGHEMTQKANFGWRQKADSLEKAHNMLLIGKGRQCKVSTKRGISDAFRLIPREDAIPEGWFNISKFFESEYKPEQG